MQHSNNGTSNIYYTNLLKIKIAPALSNIKNFTIFIRTTQSLCDIQIMVVYYIFYKNYPCPINIKIPVVYDTIFFNKNHAWFIYS